MIRGAALLVLVACQRGEPLVHHFVAADGTARADLDSIWPVLVQFFGDGGVPATIVVDERPGNSKFDPHGNTIHVSTTSSQPERELVTHESTHVGLARLTDGASTREELRFLDEGFANVMQHVGDGSYAETANAAARRRRPVRFADLEVWSTYFGHADAHPDWTAYDVAASFVLYFEHRYGEPGLHTLFAALATESIDSALARVTHEAPPAVEQAWNASL